MRQAVMLLLALLLLTGWADAADLEDALNLDGLEKSAQEYTGDVKVDKNSSLDDGLKGLLESGLEYLGAAIRKGLKSGVLLLVTVLLCALADGSYAGAGDGMPDVVSMAGAVAVAAISVTDMNSLIGLGREAIDSMSMFSKALLPTMATVTALGGAPAGAAVRQLATVLFSDVLLTLINRLLMPMVYVYVAAFTAYSAVGNDGLKRIAGMVKWAVTFILSVVLLAFVGYLSVSGVIAGSADAVTIKATKFTMSSMVPVVGGILSDAAETVLVGAGVLRGTVGVFGMLSVLAICLAPFIQLGVHYLVYKCTAALAATLTGGRVTTLIDGIGGAFGLVLGMTGACALMLLVSLVSSISLAVV